MFSGDVRRQMALQEQQQSPGGGSTSSQDSTGSTSIPSPPALTPSEAMSRAGHVATPDAVEDILTKAKLIEILRERERLQRSKARRLQKKGASGSATGKVLLLLLFLPVLFCIPRIKDAEGYEQRVREGLSRV